MTGDPTARDARVKDRRQTERRGTPKGTRRYCELRDSTEWLPLIAEAAARYQAYRDAGALPAIALKASGTWLSDHVRASQHAACIAVAFWLQAHGCADRHLLWERKNPPGFLQHLSVGTTRKPDEVSP